LSFIHHGFLRVFGRKRALEGTQKAFENGEAATMAITAVANRSSAIGLLSGVSRRARMMSQAGAYLHWWV